VYLAKRKCYGYAISIFHLFSKIEATIEVQRCSLSTVKVSD
jgi:hypothetical protein